MEKRSPRIGAGNPLPVIDESTLAKLGDKQRGLLVGEREDATLRGFRRWGWAVVGFGSGMLYPRLEGCPASSSDFFWPKDDILLFISQNRRHRWHEWTSPDQKERTRKAHQRLGRPTDRAEVAPDALRWWRRTRKRGSWGQGRRKRRNTRLHGHHQTDSLVKINILLLCLLACLLACLLHLSSTTTTFNSNSECHPSCQQGSCM